MEKNCNNCRNIELTLSKPPCKFYDEETGGTATCTSFSRWEPSYDYLKFQLSRYQPHAFAPEKRETWPKVYDDVLVKGESGYRYVASWRGVDWYWLNLDSLEEIKIDEKIIWWSYLPGEEGEG